MKCISYLINFNDFDRFMNSILNSQYFEGCSVLNEFYNDGYDVSDVLYFFINIVKASTKKKQKLIVRFIMK